MPKLTVTDAAKKLGVSKEAIHNRIRRGSIESVVENGVKLVVLDTVPKSKPATRSTNNGTTPKSDDRYYKLLEEQNAKLQKKIDILENETRTLRDQKEQMLIDEREKIENIYKEKDEQLKNILNAISSKFMLNAPVSEVEEVDELVETEIDENIQSSSNKLTSLNKYLKSMDYSKKKIEKIKDKFKKRSKTDGRIITIGKKFYIDLEKYDYSDLSL